MTLPELPNFKLINVAAWSRKEHFDFFKDISCSYSMTLNLDLTSLLVEIKKQGIKLYPTMIYLISTIVNRHEEFRTAIDREGRLGVFDFLHPSYTIFQKDTETFTTLWTEYSESFSGFYENYQLDIKRYGDVKKLLGKPDSPANVFSISSIPWVSFTGFNLNMPKVTDYLLPIFSTGKYFEQNDKIWLPIAIQVHHAVCDGFHVARFVEELQQAMHTFR